MLMQFCFMMKKDHFKQKLLLWPQVPFQIFDKKCRPIIFIQVVFIEKVRFIETTSFNYTFTETQSIQRNPICRFLVGTHY